VSAWKFVLCHLYKLKVDERRRELENTWFVCTETVGENIIS